MRSLLVFLVCVSLVAVLELTVASRPAAAADPGCYVNVDASFGATATTGSRAVDVIVLPDCTAIVGQARALTPIEVASLGPQPASIQQRCSWANRMIGAGGEGDILTELTLNQTFAYDFVNVVSESSNGTTYNHWSTGWGVISSWIQDIRRSRRRPMRSTAVRHSRGSARGITTRLLTHSRTVTGAALGASGITATSAPDARSASTSSTYRRLGCAR